MVDSDDEEQSPATIRKHVDNLHAYADAQVIYVRERITPYNRKRLIGQKVSFIVPGNQMYLPMMGIDLREHFRKVRGQPLEFSQSSAAAGHSTSSGTGWAARSLSSVKRDPHSGQRASCSPVRL